MANDAFKNKLRYHVTGAIERGEAEPIVEQPQLYMLQLSWPDGTTAVPMRNLTYDDAQGYVDELQPVYDRRGHGTRLRVVAHS
jgi:hypothetical protein